MRDNPAMLEWLRRKRGSPGPHWNGDLTHSEMAGLIERFLDGKGLYAQEWNDFVEVSQNNWRMDAYRRCCYELAPLVNSPDPQDPIALSVLRSLVASLRARPATELPE